MRVGYLALAIGCAARLTAQTPVIAAHTKGPDQINLTWSAVPDAGYGYMVEVQSASDARYTAWTALPPIPTAGGYTCDSTVIFRNGRCSVSDPAGAQVYNPPLPGVPYWITDVNYIDPQDGSPAQFIAWGLRPKTQYSFRVRTYGGNATPVYGAYSNVISAQTADYPARYVSPAGNDSNDGKTGDSTHAWRTLAHATASLHCGEVLMVAGGSYASDFIRMPQKCSAEAKAVVLVAAGETVILTSQPPNTVRAITLSGNHLVIDGLALASPGTAAGEYDVEIAGNHNALLNVDFHPPVVPSFKWGIVMSGGSNLVYRSYLHDYGSPDAVQNANGNGGFVLALLGDAATGNVVWSNHLTRGGHDTSICGRGCRGNRWLNNVMDGGWGQGFLAGPQSGGNLFEGNVVFGVGQLVTFYKPAIELSGPANSVRRNLVMNTRTWALEISALGSGTASGNLVYNNVFYDSGGCYFQSSSHGYKAYYNDVYANNICFRVKDLATRIYLANPSNRIANNSILAVDAAGKPQPERPLIVWNQLGGGQYESTRTVSAADRGYNPPFSGNERLSVVPGFTGESKLDLHLGPASPLLDAGLPIADALWGGSSGTVDLGAFGLTVSKDFAPLADRTDEALLKEVRTRANLPHARVIEAALLRVLDDDEAAAAVLARLPAPGRDDLMERFERVRQGAHDPGLWDLLASQPDKVLAMANAYLEWDLFRDALEILAHRYPTGAALLSHPLVVYYRAYCRDRLDYPYYADQDLRLAATLPLDNISPRGRVAASVLRMAVQRNPIDSTAHYLLAILNRNEGRTGAARDELHAVLKLRAGHSDAIRMLASLGPDSAPPRITPVPQAALPAANSPREIAMQALLAAASGDVNGALRSFTTANFPEGKEDDVAREAYIELRLQRLLAMAAARQCAGVDAAITHLGDEDKSLPFAFAGFDNFTKGARFQYLLGVAEFACVDQNAALKRWEKVAKATPGNASPDYAYTLLALGRLDAEQSRSKARTALTFLKRQLDSAPPNAKGAMLFNQGQLLLITGKKEEALASFRAGAAAGPAGLIEYLNRDAIRTNSN